MIRTFKEFKENTGLDVGSISLTVHKNEKDFTSI